MRSRISLSFLTVILFCLLSIPEIFAQQQAQPLSIAILKIQGRIDYERDGWLNPQPLLPGALITSTDLIYPDHAALLVLCPDNSTREFVESELIPNAVIRCPVPSSAYVVGDSGTKKINIRRGGRQDPSIPYLIGPRATVVRTPEIDLRWNAVPNVQFYTVLVRGGSQSWQSEDLAPATVVHENVARLSLPFSLEAKIAYTVQICVTYQDLKHRCTTDPEWSANDNLAFYYVPTPTQNEAEKRIIADLGPDTPESLYARAVLLSQSIYSPAPGESIGLYDEAITLLESIRKQHPTSALVASPEFYNLLATLYQDIRLPASAALDFRKAAELAQPGTETAAEADVGRAVTEPDGDASITFYNEALDEYGKFLDAETLKKQVSTLCEQIGDVRLDIDRCH